MAEKQCSYCREIKQEPEFRIKVNRGKPSLTARCIECLNTLNRRRYRDNTEYRQQCRASGKTPERRAAARERAAKSRNLFGRESRLTEYIHIKQRRGTHVCWLADRERNLHNKAKSSLWEQNAKQAWGYWLTVKAPLVWLREYHVHEKSNKQSRLSAAEVYRIRYRNQPEFQLKERLRRQFKKAEKRDGIAELMRSALNRSGASQKVEYMLGYSIADLKQHIERQFTKTMSWDAFMDGRIHIDHIIPQSVFDCSDDNEWRACWALSNLQPLWKQHNLQKRNKITYLL